MADVPRARLKRALTSLRLRSLDARDRLTGRADPLVPPRRHQFVGEGDFVTIGDEFLGHFTELAGLRPTDRVLDVGCGIGRMARPLTRFLDPAEGRFEGFDVNPGGIAWCRRHYAAHPNFGFQVADVANGLYNPDGGQPASEYRFPYPDASFDLVVATSVFTHLLEAEAARYLAESARVLAPGGRLFATFFVLDAPSRAAIERGEAWLHFPEPTAGAAAILRPDEPEFAVAYGRDWIEERLTALGLTSVTLEPGIWAAAQGRTYQDIVVAY